MCAIVLKQEDTFTHKMAPKDKREEDVDCQNERRDTVNIPDDDLSSALAYVPKDTGWAWFCVLG